MFENDVELLEESNSSVSQLSPLLVCLGGFTARELRLRGKGRVISLGFCIAAASLQSGGTFSGPQ